MWAMQFSLFQSTLPARGATPGSPAERRNDYISIHAPRTGSDSASTAGDGHTSHFNPRSPHGERLNLDVCALPENAFQSTLPARGATRPPLAKKSRLKFQSTLPARGATTATNWTWSAATPFQSTLPARGATAVAAPAALHGAISIHAPRTGSDEHHVGDKIITMDFNPRSPHGERRGQNSVQHEANYFNPRSPHGERR